MARLYSRPERITKVDQPKKKKKNERNTNTVSTMARLYSIPKRITKVEQPPKKKKKEGRNTSSTRWFSQLPDDIGLNCLARISKSQYRSLSLVSKSIHSLISSPELYTVRYQIGNTEPCLCIRQELPTHDRWYVLDQTLSTDSNGSLINNEFNLLPITSVSPSKSTTLAVGFEIYQLGGNKLPSSAVRVFDFRTRTWRDAPDMRVARKLPETALIDGKIYVVGGGTEESSSSWAEVFDLKFQTWKPLPSLSDDAEVQLCRGELFATSKDKKYSYDFKQGAWKEYLQGFSFFDNRGRLKKSGPWCVIENVKFSVFNRMLAWYDDSKPGKWSSVKGLKDVFKSHVNNHHTTVQLANYGGGSVLVIWDELDYSLQFPVAGKMRKHVCKNRRIWCAVIKLEKRFFGLELEIWGEVVRLNALLTVPKSFKLLSCITL